MGEKTYWQYGLVIRGDEVAVHEVYLDEEDGEYKVSWTEEPVKLGGFESRDDLLAAMYHILEDIEQHRTTMIENTVITAIEDD